MRTTFLAFASVLGAAVAWPANSEPRNTNVPDTSHAQWTVSVTYASYPSGAWGRNLTSIYNDTPNGISFSKADCITQSGPGITQVFQCDHSAFSYEIKDGLIKVRQRVAVGETVLDMVGFEDLEIECSSQTVCSAQANVKATVADRRMDGKSN